MNKNLQKEIVNFLLPYHAFQIGIFGSYARGDNHKNSDIDILISFKKPISLLKLVQIEQALSDKIKIKVDLVTENSLKNKRLKEYILKDLITIFQ